MQTTSRRRRKTKAEIFKEAFLPYIIFAITGVLVLVFIIGAAVRNAKPEQPEETEAPEIRTVSCAYL